MHTYPSDVVERFWAQVDQGGEPDACWMWTGTVRANGYGVFNLGPRLELAHRLAIELSGVEVPVGFVVMRLCGNRLCCNPAHMHVGTPADQGARRSWLRRVPRPEES